MDKSITIIGGGLAGCFLAILLAKRGYKITIYERSSKEAIFESAAKRSVNLTFYGYGVQALKEADLWRVIEPHVRQLKGSITQVGENTQPIITDLSQQKMPYYTVSRSELLQLLMQQAMLHSSITLHFDKTFLSADRKTKTMTIRDEIHKRNMTVGYDVIFGTDGVNSQVRSALQEDQQATHKQEYEEWHYKQVSLSTQAARQLKLRDNFMYAWTRKEAIFTAFPNNDGTYAAMVILPQNSKPSFETLTNEQTVEQFLTRHFPKLLPAASEITESLQTNPESHFVSMATNPWYYKDSLVVLGDAAHAFLPFYGQGISTAFADCREMVRLIDTYGEQWNEVFPRYQETRKRQTDVLEKLSKESFSRYTRTHRADESAIYDKLETIAHQFLPFIQPPLFISVAHDPTHAADYVRKHNRQRNIAKKIGIPLLVNMVKTIIALQEKRS